MPNIREMTIDDYDAIIELFSTTPGVTLRDADSRESTLHYLTRNPGLSFVATENDSVIGCVMCGHDGRRGYLQHLVVKSENRNAGIGESLFTACLDALEKLGIYKTHIFVFKTNRLSNFFWSKKDWILRDDINMYSYNRSANENV